MWQPCAYKSCAVYWPFGSVASLVPACVWDTPEPEKHQHNFDIDMDMDMDMYVDMDMDIDMDMFTLCPSTLLIYKVPNPRIQIVFILVQERRRRRRRRPNRFEPTTSPLVRTPQCRRRGGWWIFRRCRADITNYVLRKEASQSTVYW